MAVVKELVTKSGVRVIIRDDMMEKDQTKAWEQAKATATAIYFAQKQKVTAAPWKRNGRGKEPM